MTTAELIALKFREILGTKYKFYVNHAFDAKFTNPKQTAFGTQYDINYQAFKEHIDTIVAVVTTVNSTLVSTPYRVDNSVYTVSFWVPVNFLKIDQYGNLIEAPKFDFYGDMEKLAAALKNKRITVNDGTKNYKAYFTISEPVQAGNIDKTGAYNRVTMQVTGQISLCDTKLATGDDYKIKVVLNGAEYEWENYTEYSEGKPTDANAVPVGNSVVSKQEVASTTWQCVFSVDDYDSAGNPEIKLLEDICRAFKTELSPGAPTAEKKLKAQVRLYTGDIKTADFWGVISAEHIIPGKAGVGKYRVSISYSGE